MIAGVITEKSTKIIHALAKQYFNQVDAFELRLDFLDTIDLICLKNILSQYNKKFIFTLRSKQQGGLYLLPEQQRLETINQLAALEPDYFDLEHHINDDFITDFANNFPAIKILRSYHQLMAAPSQPITAERLRKILQKMMHPNCHSYKIIPFATTEQDNLAASNFIKENCCTYHITCHCLGEIGQQSRILGYKSGNYFNYANLSSHTNISGSIHISKFNKLTRLDP